MAESSREQEIKEKSIGNYQVLRLIARGGMGEVLLVHDPVCDRQLALKRIRQDLKGHEILKNRFLREAKITGQLTHPGVISIYAIHQETDQLYYTMPFVEGETFRQLLRKETPLTIASLIPIFNSICQTISYAHSKGIIHRDLKPENILVGKFGEVIILDWGLAELFSEANEKEFHDISIESPDLTHPGKIVGTLAYMAPERALGAPATVQSDIYALGVMLYMILTLHLPFERGSLKEFRKNHLQERLLDPEEVAPYRDVPPRLSRIVKKCLDASTDMRYQSMDELMHDLKSFLEGRSEWFESKRLDIKRKKDWEFQENVLISKNIAITRSTEEAEWVSIMLSKASFSEKIRLETSIYLGEKGSGIGFLLNVPEASEREHPLDGYCLWIGTEENPFSQLFRNTVEVMRIPDFFLKKGEWHSIFIEKIDNNIHLSIDGAKRATYLSYIPLGGTHVGVLSRDADFQMEELIISVGSQDLQVSCLSVPDAFLSSKDYKRALAEYRRIGYSFPGHAEGREALFRAGITLLEQARTIKNEKRARSFFSLALEEFEKLHRTPGAPLEYLGKSLVYQDLNDHAEEIKCLELALRRYQKHPLIGAIKEQVLYRMHESAQKNRIAAYQLILVALRHLPEVIQNNDSLRLFKYLIAHWEPLPFLEYPLEASTLGKENSLVEVQLDKIQFAIPLSFWLASPHLFFELFEELLSLDSLKSELIGDLLFSLIELGSFSLAATWIERLEAKKNESNKEIKEDLEEVIAFLKPLILCNVQSLSAAIELFFSNLNGIGLREFRTLKYLFEYALRADQEEYVHFIANKIGTIPLSVEDKIVVDCYRIWAHLKEENWKKAEIIFDTYSYELLNQESTLLHPLYGCWLYVTEGEEIARIHFAGVIDTSFPRSWALLGHELTNKILESPGWFNYSFLWERRNLYRQLSLFYQCAENSELESHYKFLERQEYISVSEMD